MKIGTPKELFEGEARVAMTPDSALALQKLGYDCVIEAGAGGAAGFTDAAYEAAGVTVVKTAAALWKEADIVAKVQPPSDAEVKRLREGQTLISFFYPAANEKLMQAAADKGATVIAMDMVPRISRAQKMDALSSMANIAGYKAVLIAADPYLTYARVAAAITPAPAPSAGIHPSAVVDETATIAKDASVGACAVVGAGSRIGRGVDIGPGCTVGADVTLGEGTRLVARVTLCDGVPLGARCLLHPGVVIGADGRLRHLEIRKAVEGRRNPFFRRPIRRWWDRLRIFYNRYRLGADELARREASYRELTAAYCRVIACLRASGSFELTVDAGEAGFLATRHIRFIAQEDEAEAIEKVRHHRIDLLVDLREPPRYWVNDLSPSGYLVERLLLQSFATTPEGLQREAVSGRPVRYVDWVLPGVLAVNVMFSSLWGVGWVIVRYRKNGFLKRLQATPLQPMEFIIAQIGSRMTLVLSITTLVYVGTHLILGTPMEGHYFDLFVVAVLGTITLVALGLMIAARVTSEELAGGLLNMINWPMMLLSGVWFSLEGAGNAVQQAAKIFPLTHILDAWRSIVFDGASLVDVGSHLITLVAMAVVFLLLGSRVFRWNQD